MLRFLKRVFWNILCGILQFPLRRQKTSISCVTPIVFGICLGVTLDMLFVIFLEGSCHSKTLPAPTQVFSIRSIQKRSLDEEEFRIVTKQTLTDNMEQPNETRPYYASEELRMKQKLFVAVLTSSNSVNKLGVAINKTLSKYVPEVVYFSSGKPTSATDGLPLVVFEGSQPGLLPYDILRYIIENHTTLYDFYLFISDKTYLRAAKYLHFVQHISVKDDVYMGVPALDRNFCTLEAGVLVSFSIMLHILLNLDQCTGNTDPINPSVTFGRCVHQDSQKFCTTQGGDQTLKYYELKGFDYDRGIEELAGNLEFNQALMFYPVPDDVSHYKLHRYFCQTDLKEIEQNIDKAKAEIIDSGKLDPGAYDSLTWPLGAQPPHQPEDKFSVMKWMYFTETHMYLDYEHTNFNEISQVDVRDLDDIKNVTEENLNQKYNSRYQVKKLINGYRKFDSTRGMEYILDLLLSDKTNKDSEVIKRVHLLRPLGDVELVPMPNISETARINIIVPLKPEQVGFFDSFIITYARSCLQSKENVQLIVAFLYDNSSRSLRDSKDPFKRPKTMINDYTMKYKQGGKMTWKDLPEVFSDIDIIDNLQSEFKTDALIFLTTVNMEMTAHFINLFLERVRNNTIKQTQVFFPIGFQQYKPNLISNRVPFPSSVRVGVKLGYWHKRSVEHACFYLSDYKRARKALSTKVTDIFNLFVSYKRFHVFRAIEPNLKLKWMNLTCDKRMSSEKYEECVTINLEGLASQRHLALLLYEHLTELSPESNKVKLKDLIRHW